MMTGRRPGSLWQRAVRLRKGEDDIRPDRLKREHPNGRSDVVDFRTKPGRVVRVIKE